ncbi:4Fe-4S binding protein [Telmatospirillum siberiense]|uniref:Electron transporter YccM n=1 Tax=Telmatospirillum siberiense TaxID=382514 RepID=A0A2N3PRF9_9PROT|nr:4Fe-4S binding protein [Telmatospirillum siberiense]PKU22988.1 electron transporter YccM [Telmatospirillum siberiense]
MKEISPVSATPNRTQKIRTAIQYFFILINIYIGTQFYFWVRFFETRGVGTPPVRPAGVDGWLPIAGLLNLKYFLTTGRVPSVHPAAMFLLVAFLTISLLLKKSFCSWLCPIGTLSEHLWRLGQRVFGKSFRLPVWPDRILKGSKYLLLGFTLSLAGSMSASGIDIFMHQPFGILADVKMLNFFRHIGEKTLEGLALLAFLSVVIPNFWCTYLCPYGALMGIVSLASPMKIRRNANVCTGCGRCTRACPARLPVDRSSKIISAECTACLRCLSTCPHPGALNFSLRIVRAPSRSGNAVWIFASLLLLLAIPIFAGVSHHWQGDVPDAVYRDLVPMADQVGH